jgi:hypothetical protein
MEPECRDGMICHLLVFVGERGKVGILIVWSGREEGGWWLGILLLVGVEERSYEGRGNVIRIGRLMELNGIGIFFDLLFSIPSSFFSSSSFSRGKCQGG